jgi:hypothetical protein
MKHDPLLLFLCRTVTTHFRRRLLSTTILLAAAVASISDKSKPNNYSHLTKLKPKTTHKLLYGSNQQSSDKIHDLQHGRNQVEQRKTKIQQHEQINT